MSKRNPYAHFSALVLGGGSIGQRHIQNLRTLGVRKIDCFDPDRDAPGIEKVLSVQEGLDRNPSVVLIASPTHCHLDQAITVAESGIPFFVEKPLSHCLDGISKLLRLVAQKKLITLVGCNMRFHGGPKTVKQWIDSEQLGRIYFARLHTSSFLPGWRKGTDYRLHYSAKAEKGGGCILDCIHEIDLARWYLGEIQNIYCRSGKLSSLEVDVEDVASISCEHASGSFSEIHLDFVQRNYDRGCTITGENGTIRWLFEEGRVEFWDKAGKKNVSESVSERAVQEMYLDEMEHFLTCVKVEEPTVCPVQEGFSVLKVALAAKQSSLEKVAIDLGESQDKRISR